MHESKLKITYKFTIIAHNAKLKQMKVHSRRWCSVTGVAEDSAVRGRTSLSFMVAVLDSVSSYNMSSP